MSQPSPYNKSPLTYTRVPHNFQSAWNNYIRNKHQFLLDEETRIINAFKEAQSQSEANIFLEIDFDKFLDDMNFHIASYEDFSSFKDPVQTKQAIYEMKNLTENILQNIEANRSVSENLHTILSMTPKITNQNNDVRMAFSNFETFTDFHMSVEDLKTLFTNSEQIVIKYSRLIIKIKQFELFFCQDIDSLQTSLKVFDGSEIKYEKISELSEKCETHFRQTLENVNDLIDLRFEREDSKLVI